ncbi:MAG TPA: response regulator transcription factor [Terriglobales bacterium]|nr:response regulator transcription factor [Terriglobales bacterium]
MYVTQNGGILNHRKDMLPPKTGSVPMICILERERGAARLAGDEFEREGFAVRKLSMEADLIPRLKQLRPSAVIIESMLMWEDALQLCRGIRCLRSFARTPLILLAATASEEERILGLDSGADDYITESCSCREVVARVRAVMRRFAQQESNPGAPNSLASVFSWLGTSSPAIRTEGIEIDPASMRISVCGTEVVTTSLEFRLLYYLVQNQGRVLTREQLLDAVWGSYYVEPRSVDACVRRLRRKIEQNPLNPTRLRTIRGAGYAFQPA